MDPYLMDEIESWGLSRGCLRAYTLVTMGNSDAMEKYQKSFLERMKKTVSFAKNWN